MPKIFPLASLSKYHSSDSHFKRQLGLDIHILVQNSLKYEKVQYKVSSSLLCHPEPYSSPEATTNKQIWGMSPQTVYAYTNIEEYTKPYFLNNYFYT